jgi:hypothetical protein
LIDSSRLLELRTLAYEFLEPSDNSFLFVGGQFGGPHDVHKKDMSQ